MRNNIGSEDKLNTLFEIYYPLLNNAWFSQLEPVCHATKLPAMGSVFPSALPLPHVAAFSSWHHNSGHPRAMLSLFPAWSPSLPAPAAIRPGASLPAEHPSPATGTFPWAPPTQPHTLLLVPAAPSQLKAPGLSCLRMGPGCSWDWEGTDPHGKNFLGEEQVSSQ